MVGTTVVALLKNNFNDLNVAYNNGNFISVSVIFELSA
jgi:hypothetical protein